MTKGEMLYIAISSVFLVVSLTGLFLLSDIKHLLKKIAKRL